MKKDHCGRSFVIGRPKEISIHVGPQHTLQVSDDGRRLRGRSHNAGSVGGVMSDSPTFSPDLLIGLTPEQRDAVMSPSRRLLIRATAGSGKTHVLTLRIQRRIAEGAVDADQVLAMTFTRKAGDELQRRLWRAGIRDVRAGTFHRAAMRIVNEYRSDHHLKPLTIQSARITLVRALVTQLREDNFAIEDHLIPRIESEIGWALSQGFDGAAYAKQARAHHRETPLPLAQFAEIIDRYVGFCRARGVLDFDLLLQEAINLLRTNPAVRAGFRHRTRALFVDETQDMNPLQFQLLQQMGGDDPDLFCVGDPNQSIYGFNGANPSLITDVLRTWPDTVVIDLTRNHRSTAAIVTVASTLLDPDAKGIEPAREDGAIPLVRSYDTDEDEAAHVAQWLTIHHQTQSPWRSMAVLARTNAQLDIIEIALERRGIPFERRGFEHGPSSDLAVDEPRKRELAEPESDAVALSTIHRAKGLEFAHVVVIGFAEGQLPNYNATTAAALAEESRLAYVALSRAETTLLITWSRAENDTRFGNRRPSRFLGPIEAAIAALQAERAPASADVAKQRLAEIRKKLSANEDEAGS